MTDAIHADTDRSTVRKDLADTDPTDPGRGAHYSAEDVAEACHAEEGQTHE